MNLKNKKLTIDLEKMNDGWDGITQKDYLWQIIDDPNNSSKYCYEFRVIKHQLQSGQRLSETLNYGKAIN